MISIPKNPNFLPWSKGPVSYCLVSSSAHVIVAEKLMGLDPTSGSEMTLLLVMLHTGTMFAVIVFFWNSWKESLFKSAGSFLGIGKNS